jgi:hypothetical protein
MGISRYNVKESDGADATLSVKATPGHLFRLRGVNESGGDLFIQVHDSVAAPAGGAKPLDCQVAFNGLPYDLDYSNTGLPCENGIYIVTSSTGASFTASASEVTMTALYV